MFGYPLNASTPSAVAKADKQSRSVGDLIASSKSQRLLGSSLISIAPNNRVSQTSTADFEHGKSWMIKASLRQLASTNLDALRTAEFTDQAHG